MSRILVLCRADVEDLLGPDDCFAAVEDAFRQHGSGEAKPPGVLGVPGTNGGFHIKAGILNGFFAAKINGNFFENEERGIPRIQGVLVLCDAETGTPLALMDSAAITRLRTASASAVAAKHLARPETKTLTLVGCGLQGRAHLRALARVFTFEEILLFDERRGRAEHLASDLAVEMRTPVTVADDLRAAVSASDIVVTCTPSKHPLLFPGFLRPGTFVAAVGADSEEKNEIDAALLASSAVVTDVTGQCAAFGDLRHAIEAGLATRDTVRAELGEVVAGRKAGRLSCREVVVFDSTGMALQDVAAAGVVWARAREAGRGVAVDLAG